MKKVFKALQEVWDASPKEVQQSDKYAFVISWDWEDAPTEFNGLPVYRFRPISNQMVYLMPNPMWGNIGYNENTN